MLEDVTSLSTVTLTVNEILAFTPAEAPGFGTRVSRTFKATKANLIALGQMIVILIVGFGPWLVVFSLPLTIVFFCRPAYLSGNYDRDFQPVETVITLGNSERDFLVRASSLT
jgi:hypothetical protein